MAVFLASAIFLLMQVKASGTLSVQLNPEVAATVEYADKTGAHPEVADQGKRIISKMWEGMCGQDGRSCLHGPYTVSLTIMETDMGLYCLGHIEGKSFDKGVDGSYRVEANSFRCSLDGAYHLDNEDVPLIHVR